MRDLTGTSRSRRGGRPSSKHRSSVPDAAGRLASAELYTLLRPPARVDEAIVAARQRLCRVASEGDHPQVLRSGTELVADEGIGEQSHVFRPLKLVIPGFRTQARQASISDTGAVTLPRLDSEQHPKCSAQASRSLLGQGARRASADELTQIGGVPARCERCRVQFRPALRQEP